MATFDLYKDGKVDQEGVESPIEITGLKPNTQYDNYALAYAGKSAKTPLSFKTATQPVTGVSLDKTTLSLETGKTATLKATVAPTDATNKGLKWASTDKAIATVDNNGKVTGVKAGQATAVATTDDGGKTAEAKITVTKPVIKMKSFKIDNLAPAGKVGESAKLTLSDITPADTTNKGVDIWVDDPTVATVVSNEGNTFTISFVKEGTTGIHWLAKDRGGAKADGTVTVSAKSAPEG